MFSCSDIIGESGWICLTNREFTISLKNEIHTLSWTLSSVTNEKVMKFSLSIYLSVRLRRHAR